MTVMRQTLTVLGLALFMVEFAGSHSTVIREVEDDEVDTDAPDDDDDDVHDVVQMADSVAGDAGAQGPIAPPMHKQPEADKLVQQALATADIQPEQVSDLKMVITGASKAAAKNSRQASNTLVVATEEQRNPSKANLTVVAQDAEANATAKASDAHAAAKIAMKAAEAANFVASNSIHITNHAKQSLDRARDAVQEARVSSAKLSESQKQKLRMAEAKLKIASKDAEYGSLKPAAYLKAMKIEESEKGKKIVKMEKKLHKGGKKDKHVKIELEQMREEIEESRAKLKKKEGDHADEEEALKDVEEEIVEMEKEEAKTGKHKSHDEIKAETERLRTDIDDMQDDASPKKEVVEKKPEKDEEAVVEKVVKKKPEKDEEAVVEKAVVAEIDGKETQAPAVPAVSKEAVPVRENTLDIDTAMPYGDLEPFGREDTAQELTEDSIKQSDGMVDQMEKAEVSEEKRAVFRALTRLRGAAITSFDGVARSQTGNIDGYNQVHKWRATHTLHHLADEESDISKWAFPENAD